MLKYMISVLERNLICIKHLSKYQKGTHCFGINVFNNLPARIKDLSYNIRQFESALRAFLHSHSFYILDEYFNYNKTYSSYNCSLTILRDYKWTLS
jgi:hypothetical protein